MKRCLLFVVIISLFISNPCFSLTSINAEKRKNRKQIVHTYYYPKHYRIPCYSCYPQYPATPVYTDPVVIRYNNAGGVVNYTRLAPYGPYYNNGGSSVNIRF